MAFFPRNFRLTPRSKRVYQFQAEGGGGTNGEIVSGETELTGDTFLGDQLYRKVIAVPAGPVDENDAVIIAHGIADLSTVIDLSIFLTSVAETDLVIFGGGGCIRDIQNPVNNLVANCDFNEIVITCGGNDYSSYSGHVILTYTKT